MFEKVQYVVFILIFKILEAKVAAVELPTKQWCFKEDLNTTLRCNYIPASTSNGIFRVHITDFATDNTRLEVKRADFENDSWQHVTHLIMSNSFDTKDEDLLKFTSSCFANLKSLRKLELHIEGNFKLDPYSLIGLDNVTVLDIGSCGYLEGSVIFPMLSNKRILPSLETVHISKLSYKNRPIDLNYRRREFYDFSFKTKLKVLDISRTQIGIARSYYLKDFKSLEVLNLSYSNIGDMGGELPEVNDIIHIKSLDLSFVGFPRLAINTPFGNWELVDRQFDMPPDNRIKILFVPQTVNISGTLPKIFTSISIKRCTLSLKHDLDIRVQHFVLQHNQLKYLDTYVECKNASLLSIINMDLSHNGLQFLHPTVLACIPNIKHLDLSKNELNIMASIDLLLFEEIFKGLKYLKDISLSGNELSTIPPNMFLGNSNLEVIDLSFNHLTQINFILNSAQNLQSLLLHNNHIKLLDSKSISILSNIPTESLARHHTTNKTITLYNNPLSCGQCDTKSFLRWLSTTGLVNVKDQHVLCYTENLALNISAAVDHVQGICMKERAIISSSVSVCIVVLFVLFTVFAVCWVKRKNRKVNNVKKALRLLAQGQHQYEFAVFLSYSSLDDIFVKHSVIGQLEEGLKKVTDIDRTLICQGDLNLRPGFHVLDETIRCIERSSVVIVIVSDHFCQSPYCHNELHQAKVLKKPILLILKGKVDENLMSPVMKLLFKQNVRVLFEENNGAYILKNTWENVGQSIIDLIGNQF